jgi:fructose-1,6-bisphosphatase/inositol monophosphatase family enzyme
MLSVDKTAEDYCSQSLISYSHDEDLRVLGEETLWKFDKLDLTTHHLEGYGDNTKCLEGREKRMTAIIDMIDGSDLLERGFGNWCSAVVFFLPPSNKEEKSEILFSIVQNADDDHTFYFADKKEALLIQRGNGENYYTKPWPNPEVRLLTKPIAGKRRWEHTEQIAICYYGQKGSHFVPIPEGFYDWFMTNPAHERLRVYNLGGNPMIVKLASGEHIHAVFEYTGQHPHDAVPGLYIGLKAGAHLVNRAGKKIDVDDLANYLLKPSGEEKIEYVLASTEDLAEQLARALRTDHPRPKAKAAHS